MSPSSSLSSAGGSSRSSSPFSRAGTPDADALEAYERLMASIIPPSTLPRPRTPLLTSKLTLGKDEEGEDSVMGENGVKRPMTKAEKQNAKKKRRKERERAARMEAETAAKAAANGVEEEQNRANDSLIGRWHCYRAATQSHLFQSFDYFLLALSSRFPFCHPLRIIPYLCKTTHLSIKAHANP